MGVTSRFSRNYRRGLLRANRTRAAWARAGVFPRMVCAPSADNYLLDGMTNNTNLVDFLNGTAYVVRPPVDAIQGIQGRNQTTYSAETGRAAGAVLKPPSSLEPTSSTDPRGSSSAMTCLMQRTLEMRRHSQRRIPPEPIRFHHRRSDSARQNFLLRGLRRHAHPAGRSPPRTRFHGSRAEHCYTNLSELLSQGGTYAPDALGRTYALGQVFDPSTSVHYLGVADPVTGITAPCTGVPAGTQLGFVREPFAGKHDSGKSPDSNAIKLLNLYPARRTPDFS